MKKGRRLTRTESRRSVKDGGRRCLFPFSERPVKAGGVPLKVHKSGKAFSALPELFNSGGTAEFVPSRASFRSGLFVFPRAAVKTVRTKNIKL